MWLGKDEQVANVLRDLIASGEWGDRLPGYRILEQRLKVNRETIEKALARLMEEGCVGPAEPGKRRRLLRENGGGPSKERHSLLVVGPRAIHDYSATARTLLTGIFQRAESIGWRVIFHHFDFEFPRRAIGSMRRAVSDHGPSRALLMTPSVALEKWAREATVPCYRLGGATNASDSGIPGTGVSFSAIVCAAADLLWKLGHRRIIIPIVSGKQELRERAIDASAAGWARGIPRVELEAMFPDQGEWLPDVLRGFWPKQFARSKPTAVIVKENNEFLSLLSYCHRQGLRIPEDVSVIQLSGDPACQWLDPQPDRFEFPIEAICQRVIHWLEHPPDKNAGFEWMDATYVSGGTVAKVK